MVNEDATTLMEQRLIEAVNNQRLPGVHHAVLLQFDRGPSNGSLSGGRGTCLIDLEQVEVDVASSGFRHFPFDLPNNYIHQSSFGELIRSGKAPLIKGAELDFGADIPDSIADSIFQNEFIAAPLSMLSGPAAYLLMPQSNYQRILHKWSFIHRLSEFVEGCFIESIYRTFNVETLASIADENSLFRYFLDELNWWVVPQSFQYSDETHEYFPILGKQTSPLLWQPQGRKVDFFLPETTCLAGDGDVCCLHHHDKYRDRERAILSILERNFNQVYKNWKSVHKLRAANGPMSDEHLLALIQERLPTWRDQIADGRTVVQNTQVILQDSQNQDDIHENFWGKRGDNWLVIHQRAEIFNSMSGLQGFHTIHELVKSPNEQIQPVEMYFVLQSVGSTYNKGVKTIPTPENEKFDEADLMDILKKHKITWAELDRLSSDKQVEYLLRRFGYLSAMYTYPSRRQYAKEYGEIKQRIEKLGPLDPNQEKLYKDQLDTYKRSPVIKDMLRSIQLGVEKVLEKEIEPRSPELAAYLHKTLILYTRNNDTPFMFAPERATDPKLKDLYWET